MTSTTPEPFASCRNGPAIFSTVVNLGKTFMSKKSLFATAVGSAFVAGMAAAPLTSAADNPFAMQSLDKGSMTAQAAMTTDGKCGQGMCGSMKPGTAANMPGPAMMDANKDGKISKDEFIKAHEAMFDAKDTNKDGFIDQTERGNCSPKMPMEGKCGGMK
jgi:uncharacterized low-complexity protein